MSQFTVRRAKQNCSIATDGTLTGCHYLAASRRSTSASPPKATSAILQGMRTKLDKLKAAWAAGDTAEALRIAAWFPGLGEAGPAILRAHKAQWNPAFYRQIGCDPDELVRAGLTALAERYRLPPAEIMWAPPIAA